MDISSSELTKELVELRDHPHMKRIGTADRLYFQGKIRSLLSEVQHDAVPEVRQEIRGRIVALAQAIQRRASERSVNRHRKLLQSAEHAQTLEEHDRVWFQGEPCLVSSISANLKNPHAWLERYDGYLAQSGTHSTQKIIPLKADDAEEMRRWEELSEARAKIGDQSSLWMSGESAIRDWLRDSLQRDLQSQRKLQGLVGKMLPQTTWTQEEIAEQLIVAAAQAGWRMRKKVEREMLKRVLSSERGPGYLEKLQTLLLEKRHAQCRILLEEAFAEVFRKAPRKAR